MSWNSKYVASKRLWGNNPSELAIIAVSYLRKHSQLAKNPTIIDVGCGYGRDTSYLSDELGFSILGIDNSEAAIRMATDTAASDRRTNISFRCCDFKGIKDEVFDILFAANLYQVLRSDDREIFRQMIQRIIRPGGYVFLNSLSVNDGEEYGKGKSVPSETNSFMGDKFLHFCTHDELLYDFGFLDIRKLYEHTYDEPHENGPTHHHTSLILIGQLRRII